MGFVTGMTGPRATDDMGQILSHFFFLFSPFGSPFPLEDRLHTCGGDKPQPVSALHISSSKAVRQWVFSASSSPASSSWNNTGEGF